MEVLEHASAATTAAGDLGEELEQDHAKRIHIGLSNESEIDACSSSDS